MRYAIQVWTGGDTQDTDRFVELAAGDQLLPAVEHYRWLVGCDQEIISGGGYIRLALCMPSKGPIILSCSKKEGGW